MRRPKNLLVLLVVLGVLAVSCGPGEPPPSPIRLQANAVGGGSLLYENLHSQDTVLWFWAPW